MRRKYVNFCCKFPLKDIFILKCFKWKKTYYYFSLCLFNVEGELVKSCHTQSNASFQLQMSPILQPGLVWYGWYYIYATNPQLRDSQLVWISNTGSSTNGYFYTQQSRYGLCYTNMGQQGPQVTIPAAQLCQWTGVTGFSNDSYTDTNWTQ